MQDVVFKTTMDAIRAYSEQNCPNEALLESSTTQTLFEALSHQVAALSKYNFAYSAINNAKTPAKDVEILSRPCTSILLNIAKSLEIDNPKKFVEGYFSYMKGSYIERLP